MMLQAIKELGEEKLQQEGISPENIANKVLSTVVQDPNKNGNYPNVFVVLFRKTDGGFNYDRIQREESTKTKISRYLYRRGSPNGPNITPTCLVTDIDKTFRVKLEGWFTKFGQADPLFAELHRAIATDKRRILEDIKREAEFISSVKKQENIVLTVGLWEDEKLNYPGDYSEFRDLLREEIFNKYRGISTKDHVCAVCGEKKVEVFGEALSQIFKFYTLDKPGYIAGGFRREEAWKNFPICLDCMLKIEEGQKFINDHLAFRMGGQRYWLIPEFLRGIPEASKSVTEFFQIADRSGDTLRDERLALITEDEREILKECAELPDLLTYKFFFFEAQKGSSIPHEITLLVEDVLPSRLSRIFEAKQTADRCNLLHNVKIRENEYADIKFRFNDFRGFFLSNKVFLEVVDRVFRGLYLDRGLVLSWLMTRIRQEFIKDHYLKPTLLRGLSALLFFDELRMFSQQQEQYKGGTPMTDLAPLAEDFFDRYERTFRSPPSKAVFLLGVLTEKLLNIQYDERGSKPFRKNLKSLMMKEEDFRGLLPKIQNKLEEYGKNYYRSLETLISDYFLQSGQDWDMSTDELNFYFVLGMNLQATVTEALGLKKKEKDKEEN